MGKVTVTIKNKITGVKSTITGKEYERLKKETNFLDAFNKVDEVVEPDEVTRLQKKAESKAEEVKTIQPLEPVSKPGNSRKKKHQEQDKQK